MKQWGLGQDNRRWLLRVLAGGVALAVAAGCGHRSPADYVSAGDQALRTNRLANAEQDYQAAVKAAPDSARAHLALGQLYLVEHNFAPAERELMHAIRLNPRAPQPHVVLAKLYAAQNQPSQAANQWMAAIALEPSEPSYYEEYAALLMQQNLPAAAEHELRMAVGLAPQDAHLHFALANAMAAQPNQQALAQAEYAEVKRLDPSLLPPAPAPAAAAAPASAPTIASTPPPPAPNPPAAAAAAIRPLNRAFLLSHSSPVYQDMDRSSSVVAQVHRRRYVRVTGISGNWLRIRLRSGQVGFIPTSAVE
jgi:tetratricopeptide (TPR) repeat protein